MHWVFSEAITNIEVLFVFLVLCLWMGMPFCCMVLWKGFPKFAHSSEACKDVLGSQLCNFWRNQAGFLTWKQIHVKKSVVCIRLIYIIFSTTCWGIPKIIHGFLLLLLLMTWTLYICWFCDCDYILNKYNIPYRNENLYETLNGKENKWH